VRVIASQWDGNQAHTGWAFGGDFGEVKASAAQLDPSGGHGGAGWRLSRPICTWKLHRAYYVGVVYKAADTTEAGVTFYLRDLTDNDAGVGEGFDTAQAHGADRDDVFRWSLGGGRGESRRRQFRGGMG